MTTTTQTRIFTAIDEGAEILAAHPTAVDEDGWPCVDSNGNGWPEHDWRGEYECPRCGAELDHGETTTVIDFDTRLALAAIGMDVRLSITGGAELEAAHVAVRDAIAEPVAVEPTVPTFRTHQVLMLAGDVIRARGWHQGHYFDATGAVCAFQAIRVAADGDQNTEDAAVNTLLDRINGGSDHVQGIPNWNDAAGRTVEEVLSLLT